MPDHSPGDRLPRILLMPSVGSLLAAALLFAVCVGLLHPRYAINDDLKVISILAGYPAGNPAPFSVNMNVLFGLLLMPLYGLHTAANWEIWLFILLDLLSLWGLLHILYSQPIDRRYKLIGTGVILACGSYFFLNITFTNVAALADFAGLCLLLASARSSTRLARAAAVSGVALVVVGSMIRIEMLALTLPIILTALVFLYPSLKIRSLAVIVGITGALVFGAYAFDRLYVRAHPDWNAYYHYNRLGQQIRDAHRLENAGFVIKRISWSANDQELFARLFFPDAKIYSMERLQYIVDHVPASGPSPIASALSFSPRLIGGTALTALLLVLSAWLLAFRGRAMLHTTLAVTAIGIVSLAENLGLVWLYKDPDYSLFALLCNTAILSFILITWLPGPNSDANSTRHPVYYAAALLGIAAVGLVLAQSILESRANQDLQTEYHRILADIRSLQAQGKMSPDAIIVTPAHGIPWEWSNPLVFDFPTVPFLDTGWNTFSPYYEGALRHYGLQPLPLALVQKPNVYLMTKVIFQRFLARYYQEHEHINVTFLPVYNMPNTYNVPEFSDIQLYKVVQVK